jgi:pyruvate kinase
MIPITDETISFFSSIMALYLQSVSEASKNLSAACIIVVSKTGRTAINISKFRPKVPIVTIVPNAKAGRLLQVCLS